MATTISDRWNGIKSHLRVLPVVIRRVHRIVAAIWVLSLAVTLAVPAAAGQLPGPSIPGLSFIALILTGSYLLVRPWVRGNSTVSARLKRLRDLNMPRSVLIRRAHRVLSTLCLTFIAIALALSTVGLSESPLVIIPIVGLLLVLVITGGHMFFKPWANRIRAG